MGAELREMDGPVGQLVKIDKLGINKARVASPPESGRASGVRGC